MPQTESWTIGRLLEWTQRYLGEHAADTPRLDAEILLARACGCRRIELYTRFHDAAGEVERTTFRELVRRRAEGTPVAYLVGQREFFSLDFQVTPDVLIPRPETEFVVLATLDALKQTAGVDNQATLVDVGTGSGNIAVALAKHASRLAITAIDLSPQALAVARDNVRRHGLAERITLLEGDLLEPLAPTPAVDFVVSNPPYVRTEEMSKLPRDVVRFEPRMALEAGSTGTEIYERLIPQAGTRLRPGGHLVLETSPQLVDAVTGLINGTGTFAAPRIIRDLAGLPRVVVAQAGSM